jgi:hypothetical protein
MLWTLFKFLFVIWAMRTIFLFGGSAIPLVLAVSLATLVLRLIFRETSLGSGRLPRKTGAFRFIRKLSDSPAPSESNSIHVRNNIKEQYL